jgi:exodeoxyribonuclease-3
MTALRFELRYKMSLILLFNEMAPIKIVSWNVNGIRSLLTKEKDGTKHKDFIDNNSLSTLIDEHTPDIVCLQEIRCNASFNISETLKLQERGYNIIGLNCSKAKSGYSGVLVLSKLKHEDVYGDFPQYSSTHELNQEGRLITIEFPKFILINAYVPNAKPDLARLDFRVNQWETAMRKHINNMKSKHDKPVIACADWNVAPNELDVHNPKSAKGKHGFTVEERDAFAKLLKDCDLVDSFRYMNPSKVAYTWWSNFAKSRERNLGWRIDTFLVSTSISKKLKYSEAHPEYLGSDHCPVIIEVGL